MNTNNTLSPVDVDSLQSRFGLRVAALLTEQSQSVSANVGERLRFAREQALARASLARRAVGVQTQVLGNGSSAVLGASGGGWWVRVASVLPLIVLAGGLLLIQHWQTLAQISVAAEVDAALLADTLPPAAYSDPGFVEFLKTPRD